jgi:hypothetical protein
MAHQHADLGQLFALAHPSWIADLCRLSYLFANRHAGIFQGHVVVTH